MFLAHAFDEARLILTATVTCLWINGKEAFSFSQACGYVCLTPPDLTNWFTDQLNNIETDVRRWIRLEQPVIKTTGTLLFPFNRSIRKMRKLHGSSLYCLLEFPQQLTVPNSEISNASRWLCSYLQAREASELYIVFIKGPGNPHLWLVQLNPSTIQRNRLHSSTAT